MTRESAGEKKLVFFDRTFKALLKELARGEHNRGHFDDLLIKECLDVASKQRPPVSLLHNAAERGNDAFAQRLIEVLISQGQQQSHNGLERGGEGPASLDAEDSKGLTPLQLAVKKATLGVCNYCSTTALARRARDF